VRSPLLGRFNVDNLLARGRTLLRAGHGAGAGRRDPVATAPVHGRMNRLGGESGLPLVVIDYAHTPDALEQALASCARIPRAR
jgi:UDP-N-acetylmuramoyl-L-alanyl-D-glutamate--2,6-diaminopimelate ligase